MRIIKAAPAVAGVYLPLAGGTMTGNILMGANNLQTTNTRLIQSGGDTLNLESEVGADTRTFHAYAASFNGYIGAGLDGSWIQTRDVNDYSFILRARDNGVGLAEIARLQSAADPYFQATLPMVLLPAAIPAALVEGHFGYDSATKRLWVRDNISTNFVPVTRIRIKAADETVNNSVVYQNDDDLAMPVGVNEIWDISFTLIFNSTAVADIKIIWTVPIGAVLYRFVENTGGASYPVDALIGLTVGGDGAEDYIHYHMLYIGGANAGTLQLQWAQNTAEVSNTIVRNKSHFIAQRMQ